jgi:hypothetical protein
MNALWARATRLFGGGAPKEGQTKSMERTKRAIGSEPSSPVVWGVGEDR